MEVGQADHRHQGAGLTAAQQIQAHHALGVLRHGDAQQVGDSRGQVDRAQIGGDRIGTNLPAASQEGRPHVDVVGQILDIRDVAVLAEESRAGDQGARCGSIILVRWERKDYQVAGAGGVSHIRRAAGAVGDVARFGLGVSPVDHHPAFGLPVAGPVVGIGERQEGSLDLSNGGGFLVGWDLGKAAACRITPGQVQVDLHRTASPAGLGLADRLASGGTAVGGLRLGKQPQVDQHLAGVNCQELRRKAMIGEPRKWRCCWACSDWISARVASAPE